MVTTGCKDTRLKPNLDTSETREPNTKYSRKNKEIETRQPVAEPAILKPLQYRLTNGTICHQAQKGKRIAGTSTQDIPTVNTYNKTRTLSEHK